jgi:hypothetical protein
MNSKMMACTLFALVFSLFFCDLTWADESDLVWSTFLGGGDGDVGWAIALDGAGNAYVIGNTRSADFPTTAGAFDTSYNGGEPYGFGDVFVAKLNASGSVLDHATFLGGCNSDVGWAIAVDNLGNAYVTGTTSSENFPTTAGAYDITFNGSVDIFVTKLNPGGSTITYSTFLGGNEEFGEGARAIAVDNFGQAYVTGYTSSVNFPTTPGAFDSTFNGPYGDVFVTRLGPAGRTLTYSTFLGGSGSEGGTGIALDGAGNAYVIGNTRSGDFPTTAGAFDTTYNYNDVFVVKLNPAGNTLAYSTFLGGSGSEAGSGIALDDAGNAYVIGQTLSEDFPATAGSFDITHNGHEDVFVARLNRTGSTLFYATFLGGDSADWGHDIAMADFGSACVTGYTESADFPTTTGAFSTTHAGGYVDAFVARLDPTGGSLAYSTFLGGSSPDGGYALALDDYGYAYVSGAAEADFPTTSGAYDVTFNGEYDVFVAKLRLGDFPYVTYALAQNYPNPFNSSTEIRYRIPVDGDMTLKIFNTLGQQVRTLVDADLQADWYTVTWDGRDDCGRKVASGVYFGQLRAGDFSKTIKMVLLK